MPQLYSVYALQKIFFDIEACKEFLISEKILYSTLQCPVCNRIMVPNLKLWKFCCPSSSCRKRLSLYKNTFFFGANIQANQILFLGNLWLHKVNVVSAIGLTGHSSATITSFYSHFRLLVSSTLEPEDQIIGGRDVIVEIDETKLGKRKYHRGHRVEGVWLLCGVERTPERKVFIINVEKRDAATLIPIIQEHVLPGTIIHTDYWKSYLSLPQIPGMNYSHLRVNHSIGFKNYDNGVHTNTIEGTNNALKMKIAPRNRTKDGIEKHLLEFIWRRKHSEDLWNAFVSALSNIHYEL